MRFRYKFLSGALIALISYNTLAAEMNAGTIHFTGEIIDPSCEISGDPGHDITVPLGTWPTSLFTETGSESTLMPFRITLISCPVSSVGLPAVQLTFNGSSEETGTAELLDVTGGATNVGIAISLESDSTKLIKLDGSENQVSIGLPTLATDSISARLSARYRAFALPVTAGPANADLTVNILYR